MSCQPTVNPTDIDLPALREKYRQEREKRLRSDGEEQWVEVVGEFRDFYETDPHSPPVERAPVAQDIDVAILGGGFGGMMAGANLRQAGVDDFRIIEMGGDFGGTWYWNRYPGVQCDIESYCYLPLLEELNYLPTEKYAYGPEIFAHCQRIGRHFGLYERALFGTIVRSLRWDEGMRRWRVATQRGDELRARFVIMAAGAFNRAKLPGIPGIATFQGKSFHTSRWDYGYTGGDTTGGMTGLADKRVAIIGTGATGIQCIPYVARDAGHLYVFQRTPSAVDARGNRPTDPEWAKSLRPGWQRERQANLNAAIFEGLPPGVEDLVCDGWSEINRNMADRVAAAARGELTREALDAHRELEDYRLMERLRRRVDEAVRDRGSAEALKAWYRFGCKRPTFNDEYLAAFDRDNVTLVDVSASRGVERITGKGLVANGVEYHVDCIVYASGFEVSTELRRRIGIPIIEGRGGVSLYDHWRDGFRTLHGFTTRGFPNQFFTGFTQAAVSANLTTMLDEQTRHIAYIIKEALARGATAVQPSEAAQADWVGLVRGMDFFNRPFLMECTPGFYNNEGGSTFRSRLGEPYAPGVNAFNALLAAWRAQGDMAGLELET